MRAFFTDNMCLYDNFDSHICCWFDTWPSVKVSNFPLALFEIILIDTYTYIKIGWLDKGRGIFNRMIVRNLLIAGYNCLMMCIGTFGSLVPRTNIYVKPHIIKHVEALLLVFSCSRRIDSWRMILESVSGDYMVNYRAMYFKVPGILVMAHLACVEMAKVADLIAFVISASSTDEEDCYIVLFGSHFLSVFRALGLPSTAILIGDLLSKLKKKNSSTNAGASSLASKFPGDCKFHPADTKDELHEFLWSFKEQLLSIPYWHNQRPCLMAQNVDIADFISEKCALLCGYNCKL